jgi:hypothetical protein
MRPGQAVSKQYHEGTKVQLAYTFHSNCGKFEKTTYFNLVHVAGKTDATDPQFVESGKQQEPASDEGYVQHPASHHQQQTATSSKHHTVCVTAECMVKWQACSFPLFTKSGHFL